jgi:hypothetical protein
MEESLAPRQLPIICCGPESNFIPLIPFMGINVIIEYAPDAEAKRAAGEIANFLSTARWKVVSSSPNPELNTAFYDGVFIEFYSGRFYVQGRPNVQNQENSRRCREAAQQLQAILIANDWTTKTDPGGDTSELSPSTIKIKVGMKPNRFPTRQSKVWEEQRNDWLKAHGYPAPAKPK